MKLSDIVSNMRIELQDMDEELYEDSELKRAVEKSVSLMTRMIPKRAVVETTLDRDIDNETLTIASSTGTLAYKPIKPGSLTITGKTLDTDYTVDYLTGIVTEIGSLLADTDYTASYELDNAMLDISPILTDYLKIERVEYPVGDNARVPFELFGDILAFGSNVMLTDEEHLRIIYLQKWTPPTPSAAGNYPTHLNDAVIIGSCGQALIYKAEKYTQASVTTIENLIERMDELTALAPVITDLTPPTAPTLAALTPPTGYTVVKPSAPSLPAAPSAPSAPSLSFTSVTAALTKIAEELQSATRNADNYLLAGEALVNAAARGEKPGSGYAELAVVKVNMAKTYGEEAAAHLEQVQKEIAKYSAEVTSYGSDVYSYANEVSGTVGLFREEIGNEDLGIRNASADAQIFASEVQSQTAQVNVFQAEVVAFQAEITNIKNKIDVYTAKSNAILNRVQVESTQIKNYLDIAGRYLASGQAKIQEMLVMLGVKSEFATAKMSSEQRT